MWRQFQHVSVHKEESTVILLEEVKIRLSSKLDWRERTLAEVHSRERKDAIGEPSVLWCQLRLLYKPWFLTQPMISNIQGRTNRIKNGGWPSYLLKQECRYLARTLGLPSELSDSTTTTALRSGNGTPMKTKKRVSDRKTNRRWSVIREPVTCWSKAASL